MQRVFIGAFGPIGFFHIIAVRLIDGQRVGHFQNSFFNALKLIPRARCPRIQSKPARRHAGRIVHVHTKDLRAAVARAALDRDGSFLDAVVDGAFTVPGDGSIDFAPILAVLAAAGYDGWLVVEAEQDPAKANPLAYATTGFRHLDALARAAGLV